MRNLSICERLHIVSCLHALCTMLHEPHTHMWTHVAQDRVVFAKRLFHLHVSPMMSHAHSSSSSCLHMSSPPSSLSCSSSTTSTSQVTLPINKHCDEPQHEEYGSVAKTTSSTGYEPNVIDNSDYSETFSRSMRNSTVSLSEKRHLHNCSLRSKKKQRTWDKLIILIKKVCLPAQSLFHTNKNGETRVRTRFKFVSKTEIKSRPGNKQIRILLERQKEQILAEVRSEIQKHEMQADSDRRSIQELTENYSFSANGNWSYYDTWWAIQARSIATLKKKYQNKIGLFVKLVSGMCETWKNCRKVTRERSRKFQEANWLKTLRQ